MRYLLTISYDGSDFFGFQRQKDLLTIQGELEKVLSTILQEDIQIVSLAYMQSVNADIAKWTEFEEQIEQAQTVEAINAIVLDYTNGGEE